MRPHRACRLVQGAARARGLSTALAVRGLVSVAGPYRPGRRANRRRRRGGVRTGAMSAASADGLRRLHRELLEQGPLLAGALQDPEAGAVGGPARLAAAGPRVDGRRAEYELLVDMIYEGYRLHYEQAGALVRPD